MNRTMRHGTMWTIIFSLVSLAWIFPMVLVLMNSFKKKAFISTETFVLPNSQTSAGLTNYTDGVRKVDFFQSFGWSLVVTLGAVALILVCTAMCAWWVVRVNTIVAKAIYMLFLLNMIVPFQMVMYPLSKLADSTGLNTPWGLWLVYLGFGAGMPVFIFTGVVKSIPQEIEEAAMIDGASTMRTFFTIVVPMMRPSIISVAILETMWIWNDYLLPYLTLDMQRFKTIPIAIQYLRGGYGSVDMGAMMACLVLAIIPIIIFYMVAQKYIIQGIAAGAVKG
ncbi:carbohydrate ABC transporter permease [Bifidobacterium longum]|uniref:carbohydrate ABC transporter permease n=1 Tax=Bifidobacterium longum TaxID=216816 RepID=UPI00117DDFC3|nr:carbohydrate ABC transporter permease [Bifidobacterium longum]